MEEKDQKLLEWFQCSYNRDLEESFAQTLSESTEVRLFFVNENQAFTDGRNIVVDPAHDALFCDRAALEKTGSFLRWPKVTLADPWNALRIITRAQTIHECLHILYTDFPPAFIHDPKYDTEHKKLTMSLLTNIIEDAYIEAVGCSVYDNMDYYLMFGRVSRLFASHPSKGTAEQKFERIGVDTEKLAPPKPEEKPNGYWLLEYLDWMSTFLLYPMVQITRVPQELAPYIEKTKQLCLEGSAAASPAERYAYAGQIFDIILPLIPDEDVQIPDDAVNDLKKQLGGTKTHDGKPDTDSREQHHGRTQAVSKRLFADKDGHYQPQDAPTEQLMAMLSRFAAEKGAADRQETVSRGHSSSLPGKDLGGANHKGVTVHENHPKIDLSLRRSYQNIYSQYQVNINAYSSRFLQLLRLRGEGIEEKQLFGTSVSSRHFGDPKRRYWNRGAEDESTPDLAVMLLIDGSGSMDGLRRHSAMESAVILHEVLSRQDIPHAIVEHRAIYNKPEIDVNILVDFQGRADEKYNLMQIRAEGNSRDGLALYWAERYMARNVSSQHRVMIILSDGAPEHAYDHYMPPLSVSDTAAAVRNLSRHGVTVVGISIDEPGERWCYQQLKEIYPNLVACNDLKRLTGQLLGVIAKLL